jgi:outer membrane protein OmpA-like peptidoglycan-associated protein
MNNRDPWLFEVPPLDLTASTSSRGYRQCARAPAHEAEWNQTLELDAGQAGAAQTVGGFPQYQNTIAALSPDERAKINLIARRIVGSFQAGRRPIRTVRLVGHADRDLRRGPAFERRISGERALAMLNGLIAAIKNPRIVGQITWQRIAAGATQLVVPNPRSEAERRRNRRVQIWLSPAPGGKTIDPTNPRSIRWMQQCLGRVLGTRLAINGAMGQETRSALRAFQQRQGLPAIGAIEPRTVAALIRVCGAPNIAPQAVAPFVYSETPPKDVTLYVKIPLGGEGPAQPLTGIFIPDSYRISSQIDVVLYLQGHHTGGHWPPNLSIDEYWRQTRYPYFAFREGINRSEKNVILVAPTLGPNSEAGWLTNPGGLEMYLEQVRAAIIAHHRPFTDLAAPPPWGHIVLACHSGGGRPMRQIVQVAQAFANNIRECWGFDCLYNQGDEEFWAQWAKARPDAKLFIHYGNGGTDRRSETLRTLARQQGLTNVLVEGSTSLGHNRVPITHWQKRLQAARFLLNK